MRISQKLDYAQRAVMYLAKKYNGEEVSRLEDISAAEAIPSSFLVQILADLKKAGIVVSKRGKAGGYHLSMPPSGISLGSVIEAVEPQLIGETGEFDGASGAELAKAWKELSAAFEKKVNSISFEDLIATDREPMWFI